MLKSTIFRLYASALLLVKVDTLLCTLFVGTGIQKHYDQSYSIVKLLYPNNIPFLYPLIMSENQRC